MDEEFGRIDPNAHQAPLDIQIRQTLPISLPDINFRCYDVVPIKMKLNNTGYTVTVTAKYDRERDQPCISGGPLDSVYRFSQFHFHWGPTDREGSEHTFEGRRLPLELHAVHVNEKYSSQEQALLEKDGVVILAYLFVLGRENQGLEKILSNLYQVKPPHTSFKITPFPLRQICPPFTRDYFSYWGSVISPNCSHVIQWLINRTPLSCTSQQVDCFRQMSNVNNEPLMRNYRDIQPLAGRTIFHCAPGDRSQFTLACSPSMAALGGAGGSRGTLSVRRSHQDFYSSLVSVEGPCTSVEEAESRGRVGSIDDKTKVKFSPKDGSSERLSRRSYETGGVQRSPSGESTSSRGGGGGGRRPSHQDLILVTSKTSSQTRVYSQRISPTESQARGSPQSRGGSPSQPSRRGSASQITSFPSQTQIRRSSSQTSRRSSSPDVGALQMRPRASSDRVSITDLEGQARLHQKKLADHARRCSQGGHGTPSAEDLSPDRSRSRSPSRFTSRTVSLTNLGPYKERTGRDWPDAPWKGTDLYSPIDFVPSDAFKMKFPGLQFHGHFQSNIGLVLTNSGETVEISLLNCSERPMLTGGPLNGRYFLDSAHFHWVPNDDTEGGTHTISQSRYEIECHFVHIHEDYRSKTEAMDHPNGLCVVSFLLTVGGEECEPFTRICNELHRITDLYTQVELPNADLAWMRRAAKPHNYFLYPGRFFGRGDGQSLIWIVYWDPIGICCMNVAQFQKLRLAVDYKAHEVRQLGDRPLIAAVSDGSEGYPPGNQRSLGANDWPNKPFVSRFGNLMAPLDVITSDIPSLPMPPLIYRGHFDMGDARLEMRNTGDAVDVKWLDTRRMPSLLGGPLPEEYEFDSAHFHWAQNQDDVGAMHRINSKRCDLECHLVHFRKSLRSRQDAMFIPDGLAVCSFLLQVGGEDINPSFAQLADALPRIRSVDAITEVTGNINWLQTRAGSYGFIAYPGPLFGADQGINVIWIVYPTPIPACCQYIGQFYKLDCTDYDRIHPLHELLDRPIFHAISPDGCIKS